MSDGSPGRETVQFNGNAGSRPDELPAPRVNIIILTWNSYHVTRECLLSLRSLDYPSFQILLVDNGSVNDSARRLAAEFPEVKLIRSDENRGFPGGNNLAIREALAGPAEYLLLLNNDTVVAPDFLTELIRVSESDAKIGIVDPKIFFLEPSERIWYAGGDYYPRTASARMRGLHKRDSGNYEEIEEVSFATGCAFLIKAQVVRQIGLMDEVFFLGFEDLDWCVRARKAGFKIYYAPLARVWHKDSHDTKKGWGKPVKDYYSTRNRILFARKHLRSSDWPLFVLSLGAYILYRTGGYLLRLEPKRIGGLLKGVLAGLSTSLRPVPAESTASSYNEPETLVPTENVHSD